MYRRRPVPRAWGWPVADGGRAANVEGGTVWQATTTQVCGLFPFAVASGAVPPGVPIGRHMHTAEPVGLDPSEWLRQGLVSNTGMWVQGQPGIGKSTIVKRLLTGLVAFGFTAVVPGDSKGEYSALVSHLGGRVWRIGRGLHSLNPLDAGPLRAALAQTHGTDRDRLRETIRARRLSLLEALVVIVRRAEITVTERRLLDVGLDLAVAANPAGEPTIPDVVRVLTNPPAELLSIAACATRAGVPPGCPRPAQHPGAAVRRRDPRHVRPALLDHRGPGHPGVVAGHLRPRRRRGRRGGRGHAVVVGLGRRRHRRLGRRRPAPQRAAGAGRAVAGAAGGARAGGTLGPGHPPGPAPR